MATINLNRFKQKPAQSVVNDEKPTVVPEETYVYKDISLDFTMGNVYGNAPADKGASPVDLTDLRDMEDIKQSLANIFNTMPGQKLLNPRFGLNLTRFVFEPMTQITADTIKRSIGMGLPMQEPRIEVIGIEVIGYRLEQTYDINITMTVKDTRINSRIFKGSLTSDGFKFRG